MITLKLLGGTVLRDESGPVTGPASYRHALAILTLLVLAPERTMSRGKLVGLLWPDSPERAARNRLNTYLHYLRKRLGPDILVSAGADVRLNVEAVECDVLRFEEAMEVGDHETAVELYEGPLLDGFALEGSSPFEEYASRQEASFRRAYCRALESLGERAEQRGEPGVAVEWWRRLAEEEPYDSRITLRLMEALAAAGNRTAAVRAAREHARLLRDELDAPSDDEVMELARRLEGRSGSATDRDRGEPEWPREPDPRTVAVLPFEDMGGGEEATFLADGLHADLLTRLAGLAGLTVISRTSVMRFRDTEAPVPDIGRALGAGAVVEGGVQQIGERLRLNVQLIDARSDAHRWAETFDRELTAADLFEVQSELAERIATSLRATLSSRERARVRRRPTESLEAYRLYLRGRVLLDLRTGPQMRQAVEWFRRAIARDPDYAPARVGLASALLFLHEYGHDVPDDALDQARRAARRAEELDPRSGEVYASLGLLHAAAGEGPETIRSLLRAVELSPSYAEAHSLMSWYYPLLGHPRKGLERAERAVDLDPLSHEAWANVSFCRLSVGEAENAVEPARRTRELQPEYPTGPFYEALALYHLERFEEAASLLQGLEVDWAPSGPRAMLALVRIASGEPDRAREALSDFEDGRMETLFYRGLIFAALGEEDRAFRAFERIEGWSGSPHLALANRSLRYHFPGVLGPLREDPRYGTLLIRIDRAWGMGG